MAKDKKQLYRAAERAVEETRKERRKNLFLPIEGKLANLPPLDGILNVEDVSLYGLQLDDYSELLKLPKLKSLSVSGDAKTDWSYLSKFETLEKLAVSGIYNFDPAMIGSLKNLRSLTLAQGSSFGHVQNLEKLRWIRKLTLRHMNGPFDELGELDFLESLSLYYMWGGKIPSLRKLKNLKNLHLVQTNVSDFEFVKSNTRLQEIFAYGARVSDLSALSDMYELKSLNLCDTRVTDLTPIARLVSLEELDLVGAPVTDFRPIANLTGLIRGARSARYRGGLNYSRKFLKDMTLIDIQRRANPQKTILTLDHIRKSLGLPPLSEETDAQSGIPPEPEPGPGPQYRPLDGKLSEASSVPSVDEAEAQASLHTRLRQEMADLVQRMGQVTNRFPELANAVVEYSAILQADSTALDVTALWAVGGALASFARSYRDQNVSRTLSEPLEPALEAKLQALIRLHGAFIMGFAEGRDLVHRADEFAVDSQKLQDIQTAGTPLLNELTENARLIDDRTRELHRPIRDSTTEFGWAASRVGYSAYLIIRNSFRAMIKYSVGENPTLGTFAGLTIATSTLAGDSHLAFLHAAIPVIQQYGTQLVAFFNHSPEMRAYIEWALRILEGDQKMRN